MLVRVTKITPGISRTLDDVKDRSGRNLALQLAGAKARRYRQRLSRMPARGGADIADGGEKDRHESRPHRRGGQDRPGARRQQVADAAGRSGIPAAAFKAEVGEDSDPFPAKSGAYYAVKVNGVTPPKLKPLDQVRADALAAWTAEEKRQGCWPTKAAALAAQAQKDESWPASPRR